jgi:hypothetical protein
VSVIRRWSSFRRLRLHRPTASDIKNSIQPTTPSFIRGFCPLATHTHTYTPVAVMEEKKTIYQLKPINLTKNTLQSSSPFVYFCKIRTQISPTECFQKCHWLHYFSQF